jgi:hypothetical protein
MNLSAHFTLAEATHSELAIRKCIDNTPSAEILANMDEAVDGIEEVRAFLDSPIYVSSWYRSPKLNAAVGSSPNSAHVKGWAIDFIAPRFGTPIEICRAIVNSDIQYDQLIYEGTWIHISFAPAMRQIVLTAHFVRNQETTYSKGV